MHLVEVLIAAALLATVCVSLPPAFASAVRGNLAAANVTWTAILASQKLEELRAIPFAAADIGESFDLLDARGETVGGPPSPVAYRRTWRVEPAPFAPEHALVMTVVVSPYSSREAVAGEVAPGAAHFVTVRTRKAP